MTYYAVNYTNYTLPTSANITGIGTMFQYGNDVTGGGLGIAIVLATFLILFISLVSSRFRPKEAFAPSMFVATIIAMMFRGINMISDYMIVALITLLIGSIIWISRED